MALHWGWFATSVPTVFFRLSSLELGLLLFVVVFGATAIGVGLGRRHRHRSDTLREPFAVLQAALLGVVGLLLAFGLALAVGRYESRRADVVNQANAIGTTYLRAQTLAEPMRGQSLAVLVRYTDANIELTKVIPGSADDHRLSAQASVQERELWSLAGQALAQAPVDSAPRLYVESLNAMIDSRGVREAGLNNRVPTAVLVLEVGSAAIGVGLLAFYLSVLGRGFLTALIAASLVTLLLLVTFDLDRPTRGLITVPATPLVSVRASMALPPAAAAPTHGR